MKTTFKKLNTEDGREFLYVLRPAASLEQSHKIAKGVIDIINKHHVAEESSMDLSSDAINIVLHGHSKEPITEKDWEVAKEIEAYLTEQA